MTRQDLEIIRQSIFDKEDEINKLIASIKTIRGEHVVLVSRLREECLHEEVVHCRGYISKTVKLAEIDIPGHFEYEEVDVVSPHRRCAFCGFSETGLHVLDEDVLKKKYDNLLAGQSKNIDPEYMFPKLGNEEKRKVIEFQGQGIKYPNEYI